MPLREQGAKEQGAVAQNQPISSTTKLKQNSSDWYTFQILV